MNVIILGYSFSFPNGTGASSRVLSYATGLRNAGATVRILCLKPTEPFSTKSLNLHANGIYKEIPFAYTCGTSQRNYYKISNAFLYIKGLKNAALNILDLKRTSSEPLVMLAFSCDDPIYLFYLLVVAHLSGAILISERNEFPFVYKKSGFKTNLITWLNYRLLYDKFDGIIVISKYLETHFKRILKDRVSILRVPILFDESRFSDIQHNVSQRDNIVAYCGNFDHDEEVDRVIKAFEIATRNNTGWKLRLIGGSPDQLIHFSDLIATLGLTQSVELIGVIDSNRVPQLLIEASILVLPRSFALFSQAGFPTKLGEYLATGKPVVVTATGDIPDYLTDGKSAYLVFSDKIYDFAERLQFVMYNMQDARLVGQEGKRVAKENFDVNMHCLNMFEWLNEISYDQFHRRNDFL